MKRQQCLEGQINGILKEAEAGAVVTALCHKHGISSATCYAWKARPGGPAAWRGATAVAFAAGPEQQRPGLIPAVA